MPRYSDGRLLRLLLLLLLLLAVTVAVDCIDWCLVLLLFCNNDLTHGLLAAADRQVGASLGRT